MDRKLQTEKMETQNENPSIVLPQSLTEEETSSVNKGPFQSIESFLSTSFDLTTQALKTLSYHEMAEVPVLEEDGLDQLHRNIQALSSATAKLRFMSREIRYLLKV